MNGDPQEAYNQGLAHGIFLAFVAGLILLTGIIFLGGVS